MVTAWSDKHPAYQALSGPQGNGDTDYFTPEINSQAIGYTAGQDSTSDNNATMQYDSYKVRAVINWIGAWTTAASAPGHPGDLRNDLPDRLHRAETARLGRDDRRLPPGGKVPGPLLVPR